MDAIIELNHGLKIRVENARIYRDGVENRVGEKSFSVSPIHGERLLISNGTVNFIIFKGSDRSILISPRLFRRSVPVKFIYA